MFMDDQEGGSGISGGEREELPTSVVTFLTKCYVTTCGEGAPCYAYSCPRRVCFHWFSFQEDQLTLFLEGGNAAT